MTLKEIGYDFKKDRVNVYHSIPVMASILGLQIYGWPFQGFVQYPIFQKRSLFWIKCHDYFSPDEKIRNLYLIKVKEGDFFEGFEAAFLSKAKPSLNFKVYPLGRVHRKIFRGEVFLQLMGPHTYLK